MRKPVVVLAVLLMTSAFLFSAVRPAQAQTYGIELHNAMMPASAGMGGASLAQPQDLQSAINGNPATLTQFRGTQFALGGGWAEPTIHLTQTAPLPLIGVTPYSAKSGTPGAAIVNVGVTQDFRAFGTPATLGIGVITNAGLGVDYRAIPESNGTSAQYLALDVVTGVGVDLTERLSVGAALILGSSYLDGPFVDLGGMVPAYALRGTVGATYRLGCDTTLGCYWQTRKSFTFDDAVVMRDGTVNDIHFAHPQNFGLGLANTSFLDGRLLLATDVLFIQNSTAEFMKAIYNDQWVWQVGTQYALTQRLRLRLGYAYNDNPMRDAVLSSIGGVPLPDGVPALRYIQGQFAAICQHRLTGGVGIRDVLPGVDFDLSAGGMFKASDTFADTTASLQGYWLATGFTWRFGRGACCESDPVPTQW